MKSLPHEDCRAKIEHDCIDLWSKATIRKFLPQDAKDVKKQKAGKAGGEKKKELQLLAAQNGARTNLAENYSVSQKEEEPGTSFHKELASNYQAEPYLQSYLKPVRLLQTKTV